MFTKLFEKRLCFKPKYIHFVYSFVAHVALSCCLRREDQFVFFFPMRSTRTCRCHGKWSFFGSSIFLVVKNPYDLRSQIRFWVLSEKRTLTVGFIVWTANGCWPFPPNYFWTRLNSLSVSTSSFAQQNTPPLQANWQHDTKTPSFDASYRAWRNGTKVGQISSFFFYKHCFKNENVTL